MENGQMVVTIIVAVIGAISAGVGTGFGFLQFMLKRKDEKEEKGIQKMIDNAISEAKDEMHSEFEKGLVARGEEGKERFDINSRQISDNTVMIKEILNIQKGQAEKFDTMVESINTLNESTAALNTVTKACAEGVKSTLYDKIYIVAERAIRRKGITADEKSNIEQLYNSYSELRGNGKGKTYANICLHELETITEEEARKRDQGLNG